MPFGTWTTAPMCRILRRSRCRGRTERGWEPMNTGVNNKRVFCVQPHRPSGFGEMLGKRGDIRLDMLEQKNPDADALEILSAAHAYQMSSARDELARHYHAGAELLGRTPNLLSVST